MKKIVKVYQESIFKGSERAVVQLTEISRQQLFCCKNAWYYPLSKL